MSDQPETEAPEAVVPADDATAAAAAAAEQMLAATEKLRARLPMMKGEPIPSQSAGA